MKPTDTEYILETFKIKFNEINYFIYANTDVLKCCLCKLEGQFKNTDVSSIANTNLDKVNKRTRFEVSSRASGDSEYAITTSKKQNNKKIVGELANPTKIKTLLTSKASEKRVEFQLGDLDKNLISILEAI